MNVVTHVYEGVQIDSVFSSAKRHASPLLFIHGGAHASWSWERYLPFFAEHGWDCHALNWFNHGSSKRLADAEFTRRSLEDVSEEIAIALRFIKEKPVIIAHSMGSLAAQKFIEHSSVEALVMIAPTAPLEVGNPWSPIIIRPDRPYGPPSYFAANYMFFTGLTKAQKHEIYPRLCAESAQAIREVNGRAGLNVNAERVIHNTNNRILVIHGSKDRLAPERQVRKIAKYYDADSFRVENTGHDGLLLGDSWKEAAGHILLWLEQKQLP